jgi:hypothetical protein
MEFMIDMALPWNPHSEVPLHKWLSDSQTAEDKDRLVTMGNIVVPLQAKKAFSTICTLYKESCEEWNNVV